MDIRDLPFNRLVGITVARMDVDSRVEEVVSLAPHSEHLNHLGTVHATVVYGLAEAASGHFLLGRFPDLLESYQAVLRGSNVKYRRPAQPDQLCYGVASVTDDSINAFECRLSERERATLAIDVRVRQSHVELLSGTFTWFVTGN